MASVEESWQGVLESVHSDRAWHLETHCARLATEMERLDLSDLTPAPDPVIDLHLYALLDPLFAAARICSRERLFATDYLLTEAAGARRRLQVLLQRYLGTDAPASADADGTLRAAD